MLNPSFVFACGSRSFLCAINLTSFFEQRNSTVVIGKNWTESTELEAGHHCFITYEAIKIFAPRNSLRNYN